MYAVTRRGLAFVDTVRKLASVDGRTSGVQCGTTHLEQLALLPALATQVSERAVLVLQQLPWRPKFDNLPMVEDEDSKSAK